MSCAQGGQRFLTDDCVLMDSIVITCFQLEPLFMKSKQTHFYLCTATKKRGKQKAITQKKKKKNYSHSKEIVKRQNTEWFLRRK